METSSLRSLLLSKGWVVIERAPYPEKIVMPVSGYAVIEAELMTHTAMLGDMSEHVYSILTDSEASHIGLFLSDTDTVFIAPMLVFKDKQYAMGYAHASTDDSIWDLGEGRWVRRRTT